MKSYLLALSLLAISPMSFAASDWAWQVQAGYTGQVDLGANGSVGSLSTLVAGNANIAGNNASQPPLVVNVQAGNTAGSSKRVNKLLGSFSTNFSPLSTPSSSIAVSVPIALNDKILLPFYYFDSNSIPHYELGVQLINSDGTPNGSPITYSSSYSLLTPFDFSFSLSPMPSSFYQVDSTKLIVFLSSKAFIVNLASNGQIISTNEITPPATGVFSYGYAGGNWSSLSNFYWNRNMGIIDNSNLIIPRLFNNGTVGLFKFDLNGTLISSMSIPLYFSDANAVVTIDKASFGYVVSGFKGLPPASFNALSIDGGFTKILSSGSSYNIYDSNGSTNYGIVRVGGYFDYNTSTSGIVASDSHAGICQTAIPFNDDGTRVSKSYAMIKCNQVYEKNGDAFMLSALTGMWTGSGAASDITSPDSGRPLPKLTRNSGDYNFSRQMLTIVNKYNVSRSYGSGYYDTVISADIESINHPSINSIGYLQEVGTNSPDLSVVTLGFMSSAGLGMIWYKYSIK